MSRAPRRLSSEPTLHRLEWVGTLGPLAFLALYHYLLQGPAHAMLGSLWGLAVLVLLLGLAVTGFSRLMFRAIARRQRRVEELARVAAAQNAQLRALNEANVALSQERLVSSVLQGVVDLSRELVHSRYAALNVLEQDGATKVFLTSGMDTSVQRALGHPPQGKGLLGRVLESSDPVRVDRISDHRASVGFPPGHPVMTTFLGTSIKHKGEVVGALYLADKEGGRPFVAEDEEIVKLFANQAAVAIHNARLNEQLQAMAVETERIRISREMHDGLAQVLSYVNTKAQAVEALLARDNAPEARRQVEELSQAARQVYRDVREGILALRTQIGPDQSLQKALEDYVEEYRHHVDCTVSWQMDPGALELSPIQEVQLLRIVQEALTNVRKHASATHAGVSLWGDGGHLRVEVADDGKGFNPLSVGRGEWPHLGMQTMHERAEALGGKIEVDSAPGRGTRVRLRVPWAVRAPAGGAP